MSNREPQTKPDGGASVSTAGLGGGKMDRYAAINARARILTYYSLEPHEVALKKERAPFERAKAEWLKNARMAIAEVEAMTFEEWQATRDTFRARKLDECFECGQQYRHTTPNVK